MTLQHIQREKWMACLLAIFFPGLGHFYLGKIERGVFIMGAFILNICAIVFLSVTMFESVFAVNITLITLLGLMLPAIYFFNIFDALHHGAHWKRSDWLRRTPARGDVSGVDDLEDFETLDWMREDSYPPKRHSRQALPVKGVGIALVAVGIFLLISTLFSNRLLLWALDNLRTIGGVFLLASGGWLIWKQWRYRKGGP